MLEQKKLEEKCTHSQSAFVKDKNDQQKDLRNAVKQLQTVVASYKRERERSIRTEKRLDHRVEQLTHNLKEEQKRSKLLRE